MGSGRWEIEQSRSLPTGREHAQRKIKPQTVPAAPGRQVATPSLGSPSPAPLCCADPPAHSVHRSPRELCRCCLLSVPQGAGFCVGLADGRHVVLA